MGAFLHPAFSVSVPCAERQPLVERAPPSGGGGHGRKVLTDRCVQAVRLLPEGRA